MDTSADKQAQIAELREILERLTRKVTQLRHRALELAEEGFYALRVVTLREVERLEKECYELQDSLEKLLPTEKTDEIDSFPGWEYSAEVSL
jgi:hypothetical protein